AFALEMAATLGTALVAVQIGLRLVRGGIEFREALFILVLAPDFYLPLRLLGTRFHAGMAGRTAAARIFQILETPAAAPLPAVWASPPNPGQQPIRLREVSYSYPGGRAPALTQVSFEIRPAERLALVGRTGAGKSTVAALLLRFVEPDAGAILVGDLPLAQLQPEAWRRLVAWVPQNPYLFHETVAENIRRGRPGAAMEDVRRAAEAAGADSFIRGLPHGYETVVGERGARLSSGQAQRIAIARALLKDAPFLILDEATSALDPEQEAAIRSATARLMAGRTTLLIVHRVYTAAQADRIVVLESGQVVEEGTHAALMAAGGHYCRLVRAVESDAAHVDDLRGGCEKRTG
ncbi:MAG: ABC transporter ATP-binding protein, partial [Armatimonadota bacterium]|nr:ABC transporter ATP-binding protein [Armatimonadota bacterium]